MFSSYFIVVPCGIELSFEASEGWMGEATDCGNGSPMARRMAAISCCCVTMIS
jgi:hypothetical protein